MVCAFNHFSRHQEHTITPNRLNSYDKRLWSIVNRIDMYTHLRVCLSVRDDANATILPGLVLGYRKTHIIHTHVNIPPLWYVSYV